MPVLRLMFEPRLKVFLGVLLLVTITLVLRAAQVQVLQHADWEQRAVDSLTGSEEIETKRGAIRFTHEWGGPVGIAGHQQSQLLQARGFRQIEAPELLIPLPHSHRLVLLPVAIYDTRRPQEVAPALASRARPGDVPPGIAVISVNCC